jgi:hypothetical protein
MLFIVENLKKHYFSGSWRRLEVQFQMWFMLGSDIAIAYDTMSAACISTLENESRNVSEKVIVVEANALEIGKNV